MLIIRAFDTPHLPHHSPLPPGPYDTRYPRLPKRLDVHFASAHQTSAVDLERHLYLALARESDTTFIAPSSTPPTSIDHPLSECPLASVMSSPRLTPSSPSLSNPSAPSFDSYAPIHSGRTLRRVPAPTSKRRRGVPYSRAKACASRLTPSPSPPRRHGIPLLACLASRRGALKVHCHTPPRDLPPPPSKHARFPLPMRGRKASPTAHPPLPYCLTFLRIKPAVLTHSVCPVFCLRRL